MPSATARRLYEDQIPSFMSIIGDEPNTFNGLETVDESPRYIQMAPSFPECPKHAPPAPPPHPTSQLLNQSHLGVLPADHPSMQNSESADSSPTTTLTTDTSSLSDPSPSSSPDSPVHLLPLNNFPGTSFGGHASGSLNANRSGLSLERPMTSPSPRRGRNMKGLSIQPPFGGNLNTASNQSLVSEPASPVFIKPEIPKMKKRPSQLSLKTDSNGLKLRPSIANLEVPASPALPPMLQRRQLKHSTSSPHMLSFSGMKSSTFGPAGGMGFPTVLERGPDGLSEAFRAKRPSFDAAIVEEDSPIRSQVASRAALEFQPHDESEQNEDQKSPSYPEGPIAIYEDNVYLYLEPTADEAAKFDVVINVAREVRNPFTVPSFGKQKATAISPVESPIPETAMTCDSFTTAFEFPPSGKRGPETPTTPKANPLREPEYIHMLWDHNTDIAHDLIGLCETIEKRTKEGKKVLVHCQQGASRSASLIIAYGIYQNPTLSVNDAYYAAQAKSRWISPNMRLMYCLQDFQKEIAKRKLPLRSAAGPRSGRSPTKHRLTLSADCADLKPKEPLTAPLPDEKEIPELSSSPGRSPSHSRGKSTPNLEAISPGPSSAPSSFNWDEKEDSKDPGKFGRFHLEGDTLRPPQLYEPLQRDPQPEERLESTTLLVPPGPSAGSFFQPPPSPGFAAHRFGAGPQDFGFSSLNIGPSNTLPFRKPTEVPQYQEFPRGVPSPDEEALMSPRAEIMTDNPIHASFNEVPGMTFIEQPPTPGEGLFSPRQSMFPRDPFKPFSRPTQVADPRSPPTQGETPIVRSIDDVL